MNWKTVTSRGVVVLIALFCMCLPPLALAQSSRPNMILILADDNGWPYFGFMGHPVVQTPNLDSLVAGGALFPVGHSPASVCIPSFRSILTGLYPKDFVTGAPTMASLLSQAGYATYMFGKFWGDPVKAGFDFVLHDDMAARRSIQPLFDFVDAHVQDNPGTPFFIWYSPKLPHNPKNAPDQYRNLYPVTEKNRRYFANISFYDAQVGQIVGFLRDRGLEQNTLILFINDNGFKLRRSKRAFTENGYRTPIFLYYPAGIPPGQVLNQMAHGIDLLPTMLDYAGVASPPELEGLSLRPLVEGTSVPWRKYLFGHGWKRGSVRRYLRTQDGIKYYRPKPNSPKERVYNLVTDPDERVNLLRQIKRLERRGQPLPPDLAAIKAQLPAFRAALDAWYLPR